MAEQEQDGDPAKDLKRLLIKREIEKLSPAPRYVLFVDMLGFSALTEAHPDPDVWDFDSEHISSSTSESARQLGRFQVVLDNIERTLPPT
jgi:hypothetical protein